ncbi:transport and Golgi organization protein 1 homolog isoform X2 [Seriola aureovittata]|uniref:transport and Golgi organization protein 1 homolog isoform X2 n=1 Tax=Seriola aureovittata TaxID=2871759 RepID=UPI0024BE07C9|nr:transport and Golgi organization protein 1 homolog isoform X2 [Seriola aureovittata]
MAVSQVCRFLRITGIMFMIFPHINLGLLSDYKICGDSACESPMSRVQAISDHHGKDCRFLSFRRGDTISVYHKLTGKRDDLWAGSIDKQFGYFPKDAVEEDQVYTTTEKKVETQKSDFFCMNEFGYPTDSSELDSDDENDDQKLQTQESELTQTNPHTDDTNAESPSKTVVPSAEFPVSAQQSDGTTTEGGEKRNDGDATAGIHEEAHENPTAPNEQGGSPSASWLGSSVTGWLHLGKEEDSGNSAEEEKEIERKETQTKPSLTSSVTEWLHLGKEEESDNLAEEEKEGERKETQSNPSLTSSVTGWLGFGGEGKPDDAVKNREDDEEAADSFTSTMTGWLGFGGETKTDSAKNEQDGERELEKETEPQVKFRGRKMSLDLEGSQLYEEEKEEMGTLEWLGNALSGGRKDDVLPADAASMVDEKETPQLKLEEKSQDVGGMMDEERSAEMEGEEHQMLKSIGDEGEDNNREPGEVEIKTASDSDQGFLTQSDINRGPEFSSVDPKSDLTGESVGKAEDQLQSKTTESGDKEGAEIMSDETGAASGAGHEGEGSDADTDVPHREISTPQTDESAEQSQGSGSVEEGSGNSLPVLSSGTAEERNEPVHSDEESLTAHSVKTDADNSDTPAMTDNNTETETHHGELGGEGESQPVEGAETSETSPENLHEKGPEGDKGTLSSSGSTTQMVNNGDQESVSPQRVTDGEDDAEKKQETEGNAENSQQAQTEREFMTENGLKAATESEKEGETGQVEESKDEEKQEKTEVKQNEKQDGVKVEEEMHEEEKQQKMGEEKQDEAEVLEEKEKKQIEKEIQEEGKQEEVEELKGEKRQEELKEVEVDGLNKEEKKQEEVEEIKEEQKKQEKVEETKVEKKQAEVVGVKEDEKKQEEVVGLKEEKNKQEELVGVKEEEKNQEEVVGLKEEKKKQEEVVGLKEEKKKQEEVVEIKEEKKQEEVAMLTEEKKKQEELVGVKEEEKNQEEVVGLKEEKKKQEEVVEIKEEKKQEEVVGLKEEKKKQEEVVGLKEEKKKQEEVVGLKEEKKKQEEVVEIKEEKKQEEVAMLKEEKKQEQVEEIKEEKKQEEVVEIKEEKKQEEVLGLKEEKKKQEEVVGLKEEKKQEEVVGLKEEKKKQEEAVGLKEEKKQEEVVGLKEEKKKQEEVVGLKEEKKQEEVVGLKEEKKKQEEVVGLKEEKKQEEVVEIKEEKKQEEVAMLKEEKKQEKVEEIKEEKKQEEVAMLKEEKKQEKVEEIKEEKKQEKVEEIKEEKKQEKVEEIKEVKEKEKKEGEEKQMQSSHVEEQMENNNVSSRPESESSEKETEKTHKEEEEREKEKEEKVEEVEEEKRQVEEMQQVKDGDRRDKEEEESLKCLNELCPPATDGESVRDEGTLQPGNQNGEIPPDRTGEVQTTPPERTEGERVRQEEDGLEADQIEDIDLTYSAENGPHGLHNESSLGQTAEKREDGEVYPSEAQNADLSDDKVLYQGNNMKPGDTETSSNGISTEKKPDQIHSDHKTDTEEVINVRRNENTDSQINDNTIGIESRGEEGWESVESQAVIPDQTVPHPTGASLPSDDHNERTAETGNGGAFGLFKNAFSFFSETPATETKDSTDSALNVDTETGETFQPSASPTPEQELDSDSSQIYKSDLHTDSHVAMPTEQPQQSPSSAEIQTSTPSHAHPHTPSPKTEPPLQTKTLYKYYKNLPAYFSADETTVLMELFGQNKLQFLDFMLESSETVTEDPDNDESILSDIERLMHYHRETLVPPNAKLVDAPQEDKEKTRTLIALQKLETLITRVRETFNTGKSDTSKENHQAEASCVGASCSTNSKDREMTTEDDSSKTEDPSVALDSDIQRDEGMDVENDGQKRGKERETDVKRKEKGEGNKEYRPHNEPGSLQPPEGVMKPILDFVHQIAEDSVAQVTAVRELLCITVQVVSSLPDDIRPGPDLYGVPWEPVIISSLVGLVTMLLFTCRCYSSVKSRMYRSKERWMAEQVAQLLDEKCKVLETLSKCQQEHDDLENSLRDSGVLAQTQKTEHLEVKARQLEHDKKELERDLEQLKDQLDKQKEHRIEQERRIAALEESMKTFEEETKDIQSQDEQAQTTLKVYSMNSDRLQRNLETAGEENTLLQESNAQLRQQVEGWAERVSELEAEMRRCEFAHSGMQQDVANKDERIMSLTDRLLRMKAWDSDLEEEEGEEGAEKETSNGAPGKEEENGGGDIMDKQGHFQKVQKLIYAAKLNADLKSVDEDKDRVFAKLNDEVKAKEDLQVSIKELENEKLSLQSDAEHYTDQVQRLQQKLQIMTEMYQENELKLHRLLTVEEKERLQKEEKLNKADKNIAMAMEELNNYRQRAGEMEEELDKTKQSYQTQISAHEKKAHNNWLAARAADRELSDIRRENALLRQKLTDTQFKLDALDKDPYALDSLARPLPFRAERSPYGPSPLGRPASETRAFLSPPTLMDGPPARLSPRGYMFQEPGGPMYRRPPPGAMGLLPPPGSLPPGPPLPHPRGFPPAGPPGPPHPTDMADGSYRENSLGSGEQEHRESGPGDRRTPPEADPRMGGPPLPGPPMGPMGPMDGPFPRRAPYGPPPPDFYPPRGPGGPPMMPMWAPRPPGMMFPPRFPPGGPPLPPAPHPHYAPPMRPPPPDSLTPPSMGPPPPQHSLSSPPQSQSPEEHRPSPEDAI